MKSNLKTLPEQEQEAHVPGVPLKRSGQVGESVTQVPPQRQDASALQGLLSREFALPEETPAEEAATAARKAKPLSPSRSRLLKSIAGLVILASVGWMPVQRLFQVSSVEAAVNAQVVTLRAPIGGVVSQDMDAMRVGSAIASGDALVSVRNPRADSAGVVAAKADFESAQEEHAAVMARMDRLAELRAAIGMRVESYRADRLRRSAADLAAADAQIASSMAVMERARIETARQLSLAATGTGAMATRQTAERDLAVAAAAVEQAKAQKAQLMVEANALGAGRFFGDSYDDVPQSVQRLDQIDQDIASLQADKSRLEARIRRLSASLKAERAVFDLASSANIAAPAGGRIWELLTAPGEQVVAGQPLVSVLDCSKLLVTAVVSETVYNTLSVGMPASFTFREGGAALAGQVVQLSGMAAAGSSLAIVPSALTRESYRVTVAADGLGGNGACPVGQTGRVVFGKIAS